MYPRANKSKHHSGGKGTKSLQCPSSSACHTCETRYSSGNAHSGEALYDFLSSRSQTNTLKGQRTRPHMYKRDRQVSMGKMWVGAMHLGKPSRVRHHRKGLGFRRTQGQEHSMGRSTVPESGEYWHINIIFFWKTDTDVHRVRRVWWCTCLTVVYSPSVLIPSSYFYLS